MYLNKYKFFLLLVFVFLLFSFNKVNAYINDFPLLNKVIYLDAGHGGVDPGALYGNLYEKDITLEITKKLALELEKKGAIVLMTREGDYDLANVGVNMRKRSDLANRANLINESNCDLYISIHLNAYSSSKWRGLQIFYDNVNKKNKLVAETINSVLKEKLENVRDIKNENGYYMYSKIKVPGILIEAGFITNFDDRNLLKQDSYQRLLASSIADAIDYYFNK